MDALAFWTAVVFYRFSADAKRTQLKPISLVKKHPWKSARGLAHSKTLRPLNRFIEKFDKSIPPIGTACTVVGQRGSSAIPSFDKQDNLP